MMISETTLQKNALRNKIKAVRNALLPADRRIASLKLAKFADLLPVHAGDCVGVYASVRSEIDISSLTQKWLAKGCRLALPVMCGRQKPMIFRRWDAATVLNRGLFGIPEPSESSAVEQPDVWVLPLLAFDRKGGRLGYGEGYYDRTLAEIFKTRRPALIGAAFSEQEVPFVPVEQTDIPLNFIVTPNELIRVE